MPDKLLKNVTIAKSGIYRYTKDELPSLGLTAAPPRYEGTRVFNIYRPATVLARAVSMYTHLPLTLEHPPVMIDGSNFKTYAVGFTGDSASIDMTKDNKEVVVKSTLTIIDNAAVRAYYRKVIEVSPGYTAVFDWEDGVAPSGESFQVIMKEVTGVNHLAITARGRGGSAACILDSIGDIPMRKSGLIYAVRKMLGVLDSEKPFVEQVSDLVLKRSTISDEDVTKRVEMLQDSIVDLPDSTDKQKLSRFVEDLGRIKEETNDSANKIGEIVSSLYKTLDSSAVSDVAYYSMGAEKSEKHEISESKESSAAKKAEGEIEDDKETVKGEITKKEEGASEHKEDEKKTKEEEKTPKTDQPVIKEEDREEKEHKKADNFKFEGHEKNETVDSLNAIFDKEGDLSATDTKTVLKYIFTKLVADSKPEVKEVKEPVMDGAIRRVMDSFKTPSAADRTVVKVSDSVKPSGEISNTMKMLRGEK
jgi:hypothetical protein